jgi:hypothetical protein
MYLVIRRAVTLINKLATTAKCIRREPDEEVIKPRRCWLCYESVLGVK